MTLSDARSLEVKGGSTLSLSGMAVPLRLLNFIHRPEDFSDVGSVLMLSGVTATGTPVDWGVLTGTATMGEDGVTYSPPGLLTVRWPS